MKRDEFISALETTDQWEVIVIGGGATGLGVALESASRGYRTLLLEESDFCKGTSSKSTKLIHGGVRYLEQGNFTLVADALRERGRLMKNAPGIVNPLGLVIPVYSFRDKLYYAAGMKVYDWMAGRWRLGTSRMLSVEETLERLPRLDPGGLRGGVYFLDGQFDDARLGICLARTAAAHGATLLNYFAVSGMVTRNGRVRGVRSTDVLSGQDYELIAKVVINCTGVFSDRVRQMDREGEVLVSASRGSHIVLDRECLGGKDALLIPRTEDGRVLFVIPWYDKVIAGTTDIPVEAPDLEPVPGEEEIGFILDHLRSYLDGRPGRSDIRSVFAGLRPLVGKGNTRKTATLARDHRVLVSDSGLVSVIGGKWTTYRKMAEDTLDRAVEAGGISPAESVTAALKLSEQDAPGEDGGRASERLHPSTFYSEADILRAVRLEWACQIEDVLARRTRLLVLDARLSMEIAPRVAAMMARELGRDDRWQEEQVASFLRLAKGYLPPESKRDE